MLTIIAVLLAGVLWALWPGTPTAFVPSAHAQGFEDPGAQRAEQINQLKSLNRKVEELSSLFRSGEARVRLEKESSAPRSAGKAGQ